MKDAADRVDYLFQQFVLNMQENFSDVTQIAIHMVDSAGIPITDTTRNCNLYRVLQKTEEGAQRCRESRRQLYSASRLTKSSVMRTCPFTGLLQAIVPLIIDGEFRGGWIIGQTRQPQEERAFAFYDTYLQSIALSTKAPLYPLRKLFMELPVVSHAEFASACRHLEEITQNTLQEEYTHSLRVRMQMSG